jgi:hypothetical protein
MISHHQWSTIAAERLVSGAYEAKEETTSLVRTWALDLRLLATRHNHEALRPPAAGVYSDCRLVDV